MLLIQDHEIVFPQASFITSKKQVTARPNYDPFQYLLNNTWVTDQPRFHVAISDDNNNWSLSLPWPSESNPHTVIWTIERTDGSIIFGTIPEGVAGPVSVYQLLNTYNWSIQTGPENVFTPASLSQNADFSTINLSALSNQIFVTPNGTLSWSPTLPRVITFPDVSGTVLTTGNLSAITGAIAINSLTVQTPNISTIGITVKGTLGQVADLQEWQDSTGAVKALINTQQLLGPSGTTTVPGIGFISDSTTGINNLSPGTMNLMVSGAQMFSVTSTGLTGQASGARFKASSDPISYTFRDNTGIGFDQWGNSHLQIYTASIVRMLVSNTGLVGIGTGGGATLPVAQLHIANSTASNIGTIIKGAPSQTADLQQWQDSTGAVLASIHGTNGVNTIFSLINNTGWTAKTAFNFGGPTTAHQWSLGNDNAGNNSQNFWLWDAAVGTFRLFIDSGGKLQVGGGIGGDTTPVANLDVRVGAANTIGTVIRGFASQVSDLQEWQDSTGAVLARVDSGGNFLLPTGNGVIQAGIWQSPIGGFIKQGSFSIQLSGSVQPLNGTGTNVPIIVQGGASQTADLQQWQDSTGYVLSKIAANGAMTIGSSTSFTSGVGGLLVSASGHKYAALSTGTSGAAFAFDNTGNFFIEASAGIPLIGDGINGITPLMVFGSTGNTLLQSALNYGTSDPGTQLGVITTASKVGVIIKGAIGQFSDLQQWQNSTGGVLASVTSTGALTITSGSWSTIGFLKTLYGLDVGTSGIIQAQSGSGDLPISNAYGTILLTTAANKVVLTTKGSPSQTADLQQWQDSTGAVLARVRSDGAILASTYGNANGTYILSTETSLSIIGQQFASPVLITKGAPGQTADLQQWQNSVGTPLLAIDSSGDVTTPGTQLVLQQTGDGIGTCQLILKNRTGYAGAEFKNLGIDLVDFIFTPSSGSVNSRNIRLENRGLFVFGTAPELQLGVAGNPSLIASDVTVLARATAATNKPLTVKGAPSQTADLVQVLDSANAIKARIDPSGAIAPQNGARITSGIGAPTTPGGINPTAGDFYLRTDGSTGTHIYFCSVGGATPTWVALV